MFQKSLSQAPFASEVSRSGPAGVFTNLALGSTAGTALFIAAAVALGFATTLSLATPWDGAREQEKVTSKFLRSDVHASIMAAAAVG